MNVESGVGKLYFGWFAYRQTILGVEWFKAASKGYVEFSWLDRYLI